MLKSYLIVLGLFLLPFLSFSQRDYFKGYVVPAKGDTLVGYVKGKESGNTLQQAQFKVDHSAALQNFSVENCVAFGLYDRDAYERYIVNISLGTVKLSELSTGIDTTSKREAVFLQVLQKGNNVTLYAYTDEIKTRFYIKDKFEKEPVELLFYSFHHPDRGSQIVYNSKYQRQLSALFKANNVEIEDYRLERSSYDENDIVRFVSLINNYKKEKSKYKTHDWYVGAGLAHLSTKYVGEHVLAGDAITSKTAIVPFISAGLDVYVNPAYAKTFFRIEASVFRSKHSIEKKEVDFYYPAAKHEFKQLVATLTASLLRNFYVSDNYKVYFGLGLAIRYANTSDNTITYRYTSTNFENSGPDLKKIKLQLPISAGVMLSNKFDISANYIFRANIADNYTTFGINSNQLKLGLNYRL